MSQYQDDKGILRVGGGLTSTQKLAMDLGQVRAVAHLQQAGNLSIENGGSILKVTNLTGHKLITGYPEGRRMWLNIKWYDGNGALLREDGEYGGIGMTVNDENGNPVEVESILDLDGANTKIYEAHYAITKDWAATVQALHGPDFTLSYDRLTGDVKCTVSQFINGTNGCTGEYHNTFHFALNNYVSLDNRIPPYGMSYDEAKRRNALPVPVTQYGNPAVGGTYKYWDEFDLNAIKPSAAVAATIELLYQGTSWEYIQFLQLANNGTNAFLGQEGEHMMAAWINAGVESSTGQPIQGVLQVNGDYRMVPPVVMDSIEWGTPPVCEPTPGEEDEETSCTDGVDNDCDTFTDASDSDCDTPPVCVPTQGEITEELSCTDGLDNDCDSDFDCDDSDCSDDPACQQSICGNYLDKGLCNDDPNCVWEGKPNSGMCVDDVACVPEPEICDDNIDNDCDGLVSCDDIDDCGADPACQTTCNNDGVCDPGEDCLGCANDCAGVTGGKPANRYCCGNGIIETPEGDGSVCDGNY
jgi:hypothetical protein